MIIKESIKQFELDKHLQEHLQATSVHINDGNNDLTIFVIYCLSWLDEVIMPSTIF